MARHDEAGLAALEERFVRVRAVRMNESDLGLFQFDWDLTWAAFFLNAQGHVYARYGVRDESGADRQMSVAGLKAVMQRALDAHTAEPDRKPAKWAPKPANTIAGLPSDLKSGGRCLHCHQVWQFTRVEELRGNLAAWKRVKTDIPRHYPLPRNLGFALEVDRPEIVASVAAGTPAAKAGLGVGDALRTVNGTPVYSAADVSFVLHRDDGKGPVEVEIQRGNGTQKLKVTPSGDWRTRDISWRGSMWPIEPRPGFWGPDLSADEKAALKIAPDELAAKVNGMAPGLPASKAGLKVGDVVIEVAGQRKGLKALGVQALIRLTYNDGDTVPLVVLRDGKPTKVALKLFIK